MEQGIRVFLCSTYADLVEERQAVLQAIRDLKLQHESMEFFGAKPNRPIDVCLAEVAKSNVLVVIVGHKYGTLVPGRTISFSEAEYQEGYKLNKPCLVYMRDATVRILPDAYESDPEKLRALKELRTILNDRHTVATFRAPEDLAQSVTSDLRETVELVESQRDRHQEVMERRSAFLIELESIANAALAEGHREALILSAVRGAVGTLRDGRPTLARRVVTVWDSLIDMVRPLPERQRPWVFFSYAHPDKKAVQSVAEELRKLRVRVWVDQQELVPGDSLLHEIQRGLDRASALVFFASKASLSSKWARHELDFFMTKRVSSGGGPPVLPVVLEEVEMPAILRDILYIDMRRHSPRETARRIAAVVHEVPLRETG